MYDSSIVYIFINCSRNSVLAFVSSLAQQTSKERKEKKEKMKRQREIRYTRTLLLLLTRVAVSRDVKREIYRDGRVKSVA